MKHFFKYFVIVLVIVVACDSNESKPRDIGLNYFPLRTGFFQIYSVESIQYSEVNEPVTLNYELKTEVVDSFPSGDSPKQAAESLQRLGSTRYMVSAKE